MGQPPELGTGRSPALGADAQAEVAVLFLCPRVLGGEGELLLEHPRGSQG